LIADIVVVAGRAKLRRVQKLAFGGARAQLLTDAYAHALPPAFKV